MSSTGIKPLSSGPLIIRTYNDSSINNTFVLGAYDTPVSSGRVLITSSGGRLVPSDNITISSINVGTLSADVFYVSTLNASTLDSYIPYVGAISNVNLNGKQLKNIADATDPHDAVAFGQISSITGLVPYTSSIKNVDLNAKLLRNIGNGILPQDAVALNQLGPSLPAGSAQGSYIVYDNGAYINNSTNSINLGLNTYSISPSSINIGHSAGAGNSGSVSDTVNIGQSTGSSYQANQTVAIGSNAGATSQGLGSVAIGYKAGYTGQSTGAIAIGWNSAPANQEARAIAIGESVAGDCIQGAYSIGIGYKAAYNISAANSIVLNAIGSALDAIGPGFFVAPLRDAFTHTSSIKGMMYQLDTKEIVYNQTTIWNVIIIGQATPAVPLAVPLAYFMPSGQTINPAQSYPCTVTRAWAGAGNYEITFPLASSPNFGDYTTITTGANPADYNTTLLVTAFVSSPNGNSITINCFLANPVAYDLLLNDKISLRVEF